MFLCRPSRTVHVASLAGHARASSEFKMYRTARRKQSGMFGVWPIGTQCEQMERERQVDAADTHLMKTPRRTGMSSSSAIDWKAVCCLVRGNSHDRTEWLERADPQLTLELLKGKASERKLRFHAC